MNLPPGKLVLTAMVWTSLLAPVSLFGQITEYRNDDLQHPPRGGTGSAMPDLDRVEQLIIEQTNEFRVEHDRQKVKPNEQLNAAAEDFAGYMARTNRYGHTADGNRPSERAKTHGYEYCLVSENIAYQFSTAGFETEELATRFVEGWIDSEGHRKNMLEPAVVDIGVAVAKTEGEQKYFAVQMFGRPQSMHRQFQVLNQSGTAVTYRIGDKEFLLPPLVSRTHFRCTQVKLTFTEAGTGDEAAKLEGQIIQPETGTRYVIESVTDGALSIETIQMERETE
ncbi:MAG: CAP domain-containing protein [Planctomycetaceae bacterium]